MNVAIAADHGGFPLKGRDDPFAMKVIAALRNEFGGHAVTTQ